MTWKCDRHECSARTHKLALMEPSFTTRWWWKTFSHFMVPARSLALYKEKWFVGRCERRGVKRNSPRRLIEDLWYAIKQVSNFPHKSTAQTKNNNIANLLSTLNEILSIFISMLSFIKVRRFSSCRWLSGKDHLSLEVHFQSNLMQRVNHQLIRREGW